MAQNQSTSCIAVSQIAVGGGGRSRIGWGKRVPVCMESVTVLNQNYGRTSLPYKPYETASGPAGHRYYLVESSTR